MSTDTCTPHHSPPELTPDAAPVPVSLADVPQKAARKTSSVFLAVPHYGSGIVPAALPGLFGPITSGSLHLETNGASLLAHNFNRLWVAALHSRPRLGTTHFAMHHSDIEAPPGWCSALIDEMDRVGADVLSVAVPIKDHRGLLSMGFVQADGTIRRLTMKELYKLPETFSTTDVATLYPAAAGQPLAVNTGLWVCRFDQPWAEEFPGFEIRDQITRISGGPLELPGGTFMARVLPEDWGASVWWHRRGLRVFATRKVRVVHHGAAAWGNDQPWGEWETDHGDGFQG